MFKWSLSLRALVYLRQISRELRRANDLAALRLSIEHPTAYKARVVTGRKGPVKLGEISTPTVEAWNENYRQLHPQADGEDNPY